MAVRISFLLLLFSPKKTVALGTQQHPGSSGSDTAVGAPSLDVWNNVDVRNLNDNVEEWLKSIPFHSIFDQSHTNKSGTSSSLLDYGISTKGRSSLRDLTDDTLSLVTSMLQEPPDDPHPDTTAERRPHISRSLAAMALLCHSDGLQSDAAHEVILGVAPDTVEAAEYAATHPGQTSWAKDHPFSRVDDMLHSLIHAVCEGSSVGEGGYTGFENAGYWAAGGPKRLYGDDDDQQDEATTVATPTTSRRSSMEQQQQQHKEQHPVRTAMAESALTYAPLCCQAARLVCVDKDQRCSIIAGYGKHRTVKVPARWWNAFAMIELLQKSKKDRTDFHPALKKELRWLQELELRLLTRHELLRLHQQDCDDMFSKRIDSAMLLVWE